MLARMEEPRVPSCVWPAAEDASTPPRLEHDRGGGVAAHGVVARPPQVDAGGPHLEGVWHRGGDVELELERVGHRGSVFSAAIR